MNVKQLKENARRGNKWGTHSAWVDTGERLIWCGMNEDGSFTFRNTVDAFKRGPAISEAQAQAFLDNA